MAPKITAIGEVATVMAPLPKGLYHAVVTREKLDYSKKTSAPMICLGFQIDEGDYAGRNVPPSDKMWFRVMVGGTKEDGTPHNLGRWLELVNALSAIWTCSACGTTSNKKFVREKGLLFCPSCGKEAIKAGVDFDGELVGLKCRIIVDQRDVEGFDEPLNDISGVRPE